MNMREKLLDEMVTAYRAGAAIPLVSRAGMTTALDAALDSIIDRMIAQGHGEAGLIIHNQYRDKADYA
jgi:hypothetical protein